MPSKLMVVRLDAEVVKAARESKTVMLAACADREKACLRAE